MGEGREHDWACLSSGMFSIVPCVIRDVIMIKAGRRWVLGIVLLHASGRAPPEDAGPGVAAWIVSNPRGGLSMLLGPRPRRFNVYASSL